MSKKNESLLWGLINSTPELKGHRFDWSVGPLTKEELDAFDALLGRQESPPGIWFVNQHDWEVIQEFKRETDAWNAFRADLQRRELARGRRYTQFEQSWFAAKWFGRPHVARTVNPIPFPEDR